jgi:APA family basic amino acid/polyamine antiporter
MANIGTLFAFVLVAAGILFLRKYQPNMIAAFRTPFVPLVPILAIVFCLALMFCLPAMTWIRFVVWMALGFEIYTWFGFSNARHLKPENFGYAQRKMISLNLGLAAFWSLVIAVVLFSGIAGTHDIGKYGTVVVALAGLAGSLYKWNKGRTAPEMV